MAQRSRNSVPRRYTSTWPRLSETRYTRRLRFEPLEERRMLAILADTFDPAFAQVSRIVGSEVTVLTVDGAGHSKIFYRPNDELGYVDPETGNLLNADYYAGTSTVLVLDATPSGNLSDLVGVTYSNGQVIATNGGNTVYHRDGSIMRSGGVWTYDAGATLENASGDWFWSNGIALKSGALLKHPNGNTLFNGNQVFYANGATFENSQSAVFYPGGQQLRDNSSNYYYQAGGQLDTGNVLSYSNGTVMADSSGNVFNDDGSPSFTPFTRIQTIGTNEVNTHVENQQSDTVIGIQNSVSGSMGAYIARIHLNYQVLPPNPLNIAVTAPDATSLHFTWTTGGGTTAGYRVAVANGVSPPSDPAAGTDTTNNYYDVTGLTAGQKVSIRVWASDGSGHLSSGIFATGTPGRKQQAVQTGELIASSLDTTFAQIYDSSSQNIIYTVDQSDNYFVFVYGGDEMGWVNTANGDRLLGDYYTDPATNSIAPELTDFRPIGNIADIPDGATYSNGFTARSGNSYYYNNGATLRNASLTWFHSDGTVLRASGVTYWLGGTVAMHSGTTSRYPDGNILKSGTTMTYDGGVNFLTPGLAFYPSGIGIMNAAGDLFYENASPLLANSTHILRYRSGPTMVNDVGMPFDTTAEPLSVPFEYTDAVGASTVYVGENDDRIARYTVSVLRTNAVYAVGGTIDYNARNGDFNHDAIADAGDYVLGRKLQGSTFDLSADANASGTIDPGDLTLWRAHYGQTLPALGAGTGAALTEPPADFDKLSPEEPGAAGVALVAASIADPARQPPALPGVLPASVLSPNLFSSTAALSIERRAFSIPVDQAQPDLQPLDARLESQPLPTTSTETTIASRSVDPDPHDLSLEPLDDAFAELAGAYGLRPNVT